MVKYLSISAFIFCMIFIFACDNKEESNNVFIFPECDVPVRVDRFLYDSASSSQLYISNINIVGSNCLLLNVSSTGCSGDNWKLHLYDSEEIVDSSGNVHRYLKIDFTNPELCQAIIDKTYYFDLFPVQVNLTNEVFLHFRNSDRTVLYSY